MNRSSVGKMRKTVGWWGQCIRERGGYFELLLQLFGIALFVCTIRYNVSFKRSWFLTITMAFNGIQAYVT